MRYLDFSASLAKGFLVNVIKSAHGQKGGSVEKKTITVEVAKETYELGEGLAKLVKAVREALKDGWQPGTDIPAILSSAVTDLVPAVQGAEKIGDELKEDKKAFADAIYLGLSPIVYEFTE